MKKLFYILLFIGSCVFAQNPNPALISVSLGDYVPPVSQDGFPIINNFNITNAEPNKVQFDASETITATTVGNFLIEGKTISSVTIDGDGLGGYFTLSANLTFWDNILIRYEGGSNMQDVDDNNAIYNFTLQYIENNINEPSASNDYFVATDGLDTNNGTSVSSPWKTIDKAASTVTSGSTVWIKAGDYGSESVVVSNDGLIGSPIKFIGYKDVAEEGNAPLRTRSVGMTFDSAEMPYLTGSVASFNTSNEYIIIKNIQILNTSINDRVFNLYASQFVFLYNCYSDGGDLGIYQYQYSAGDGNTLLDRCYSANAKNATIRLRNSGNLVKDTWAVTSYATSDTDYYINIYGGLVGHSNTVIDCVVDRVADDTHTGHGISFKGGTYGVLEYSLMVNSTSNALSGAIEFRHSNVKYNVARNITMDGLRLSDGFNKNAVKFQDGASLNILENSEISNFIENGEAGVVGSAIYFYWSSEDPINNTSINNTVRNCIIDNCDIFLLALTEPAINNKFYNNTINDCVKFSSIGSGILDNSNIFTNNIVTNSGTIDSDDNMVTDYNDSYNNSFGAFSGTGNITDNPTFTIFPTPTNTALNAGLVVTDLDYDINGVERSKLTTTGNKLTIGAIEIDK